MMRKRYMKNGANKREIMILAVYALGLAADDSFLERRAPDWSEFPYYA